MPINRRVFIKISVAGAVGFGVASAIEIPILENTIHNDNTTVSQLQTQITQSQGVYLTLNPVWGDILEFNPEYIYVVGKKIAVIPLSIVYEMYRNLGWTERMEKVRRVMVKTRQFIPINTR